MAKANTGSISQLAPLSEGRARLEEARLAMAAFIALLAQCEGEVSIVPRELYYLLRPIGLELDAAADELASMSGSQVTYNVM
jgi:hypothetical protein